MFAKSGYAETPHSRSTFCAFHAAQRTIKRFPLRKSGWSLAEHIEVRQDTQSEPLGTV